MTDLERAPSSIRDDSICESSLPPNKSSGDIGERTWTPEQFWEFTEGRDGGFRAQQQRNVMQDVGLVIVPAAEIERLRRERDEARQLVTEANNSLFGSQAYFHSMNGGPFDRYHLSRGIEQIKDDARRHWQESQAAESAVAAAWEEAADWHDQQSELAMNSLHCGDNTSTIAAFRRSANWHTECAEHFRSRASAIRAAVSKKTAESGHSPSTHNSESE